MNKYCSECGADPTFVIWGCCAYYGYAMCDDHAYIAQAENWGAMTNKCNAMEIETLEEWISSKRPEHIVWTD